LAWEERTIPDTINNFVFIPSVPGIVVAIKGNSSDYLSAAYSTDDGEIWTDYGSEGPLSFYLSYGLWGVGDSIVTLGATGLIQFTTDGIHWQTVNNGFSLGYLDFVSSPSSLVAIGTNAFGNTPSLYQSVDSGSTWNAVLEVTDGNTNLQWLPQIHQWARFGDSLELSTDLQEWNTVSALPYLLGPVQYLEYYQAVDEDSSGWVVGALTPYGYTGEAFQLGFCDTQFSDCRAIERWNVKPIPGDIAVGNDLLAFAIVGDSLVNFTTLPLPSTGPIEVISTKLPTPYDPLALANIFFANGYFFFWSSSTLAYSDGTSDWEPVLQMGINVVEYISEISLFLMVDQGGNLWTSAEGTSGWTSSVISSGDYGINKVSYSNGYLVALNVGDGAMYRLEWSSQ
jgi:hypothetical protein